MTYPSARQKNNYICTLLQRGWAPEIGQSHAQKWVECHLFDPCREPVQVGNLSNYKLSCFLSQGCRSLRPVPPISPALCLRIRWSEERLYVELQHSSLLTGLAALTGLHLIKYRCNSPVARKSFRSAGWAATRSSTDKSWAGDKHALVNTT